MTDVHLTSPAIFITFEGLDSSGKTTQANLLVDRLRKEGRKVLLLREPGGTTISERIRDILLDRKHFELTQTAELLLFSASRTQLVSEVIDPALHAGTIVVCDRFVDSTTAYQGFGRGLPLDEVKAINRIAIRGTSPTITVLVEIETDEMFKRQAASGVSIDRMESAGRAFFEKVRAGYRTLAREEPYRFVVVDGMRPITEIHNDIWKNVQARLK